MRHCITRLLINTLGLIALPGLLGPVPVVAADTLILSLDSVRELALERNSSLQRQTNSATLSQVALDQARAARYPDLRLSAGASERLDRTVSGATGDLETDGTHGLSLQLSSSVNLFDGSGTKATIEAARLAASATTSELERSREAVVHMATAGFLRASLDLELVGIETERLDSEQQQLERIESLHEVGERPWADVLQQRTSLAQAKLGQLNARRAYELDLLTLKELLALNPDTQVELRPTTGLPESDPTWSTLSGELPSLLEEALRNRADVAAQTARVQAAEESIRAARSGYWPSVDLTVGAGSSYSSRDNAFDFADQLLDANPNASVGLALSLPILDREQTDTAVRRARIELANERLVYDDLVRQVGLELEQALLNYRIAAAQLGVSQTQIQYAREALAATEARYFEGLATLVEVSQARSQYVEAAGSRATAQTTTTLRLLEIELQLGGNTL